MTRSNPCKRRYAGCSAQPAGGSTCESCRAVHAERAAARREALKSAARCVVCGKRAVIVGGEPLTTCKAHREYYNARAAG